MKNEVILNKAVLKAISNGWKPGVSLSWLEMMFDDNKANITMTIFSHDFAKAFWGKKDTVYWECEEDHGNGENRCGWEPAWQYHLQPMVLDEDPVKYLKKFL